MTSLIWVIVALMSAVAAVGLAIPLVRRYDSAAREGETVTAIIRGQLAEVDAQVASGQVEPGTADALRTELKRRLLVEARARSLPVRLLGDRRAARLALLAGSATALVATGIYAVTGRPDLPAATANRIVAGEVAAATGTPAPAAPTDTGVATILTKLEAKAAANPGDVTGWRLLGGAYFQQQRFSEAARAFARAVALSPATAELHSAEGEALTQGAGGVVTPAAATAFRAARAADATDPRARYFLALETDQHGDHRGAIDAWVTLLNSAAPDAPWAPELRRFVMQAARDAKIDLAGRLHGMPGTLAAAPPVLAGAANARGPDAGQVAAASGMTDAGRAAFIAGMVDNLAAKLKANPRDADGWIRLIRARQVMGDAAAAKAALANGRAAFADTPARARQITDAAAAMGVTG